jgi:adenylate kinase
MLNVVIFGAPGSGKGTHSKLIVEKYDLYHISTGDVLRKEIENQSEYGEIANQYIKTGQLVPDDLIIKILSCILDKNPDTKGYIFDGFPRTIAQGVALENLLREKSTDIVAVLNLVVEEDELIKRVLNRGKETGRNDDNLETIKNRLVVYHTQTKPLETFYKKKGKLFNIKGNGSIEDIFEHITEVLDRLTF